MRIYVAGPLSSNENTKRSPSKVVTDYIQNLHTMLWIATAIRRRGHHPYVPGLDLLLGVVSGGLEEEDYRELGMSFLEVCDAVYVVGQSWGVEQELKRAKELGLPVYFHLEDIPEA